MAFKVVALDADQFSDLFELDNETLASRGVERHIVDAKPGYPCRVSLVDCEIGDSVLLINFEHQPAATPYRSSHALFVREGVETAKPGIDEVPELLKIRMLSVRAFDKHGAMLDAELTSGENLGEIIERLFANREVEYLHAHNAARGCYSAKIVRA